MLRIVVTDGSSEGRFLFTFDFEVVSSKTVGFEVKGQRRIGLIQEQVDPGQLNAVPLKHWAQNLSARVQTKHTVNYCSNSGNTVSKLSPFPPVLPKGFLFHRRYNFCVNIHVEVKLEAEALLAGVLQGGGGNRRTVSLHRWGCSPLRACVVCELIHMGAPSHCTACLRI